MRRACLRIPSLTQIIAKALVLTPDLRDTSSTLGSDGSIDPKFGFPVDGSGTINIPFLAVRLSATIYCLKQNIILRWGSKTAGSSPNPLSST